MGVVSAEEEEHYRHREQKLLGWRVLIPIVDLLPHVEVIVGTGVELERDAPHPMEHEEGTEHVADIGQGPRGLLRNAWHNVVEDFQGGDEDEVDGPGPCSRDNIPVSSQLSQGRRGHDNSPVPVQFSLTFRIYPVCIEIWQGSLVACVLDGLGGLLVDDTAGPPPTALLLGVGARR